MRRVVSASLLRLVSGSAVAYAYFVFWACAPISVVAPMVPWDQQNGWDVGGAVSAGATRTAENVYVENDNGALEIVGQEQQIASALGAQVWAVQDVGRVDLGMTIGGAGVSRIGSALHGGVMVRPHLVETDDLVLGLDVQLGWFWGSVGLPVSVRASDRVWVYTDPSLGLRVSGVVNVPVGLSVEVTDKTRFNAEVSYTTGSDLGELGYLESGLFLGSVGISHRP